MYTLGIDLGGTNIKIVIINNALEIIDSNIVPTPQNGGCAVEAAISAAVRELLEANSLPVSDIKKAGLAIPGVVKIPKGPILLAPNIGLADYDIVTPLEQDLGIPFSIGNDADCMALAENSLGAGVDFESFIMLAIGTGVGGAIVADNKLFTGFTSYGGEMGHVPLIFGGLHCNCGQDGCLEQYASAPALIRIAKELSGRDWIPEDLFPAAQNGDPQADEIINTYVSYLCAGIAGYVNVLRPHGIILGGGIAGSGPLLYDKINALLPTMTFCGELIPAPPVVPAKLGMFAGALGAALL